jgi:hypothetical protein
MRRMRTGNNRAAVTAGTNPAVAADGQHREVHEDHAEAISCCWGIA